MLVRQLPSEAALWRSIDGADSLWGLPEQLAALQIDVLQMLLWSYQVVNRGKAPVPARPKPIPRPGLEDEGTKEQIGGGHGRSYEQVKAYLARFAPQAPGAVDVEGGEDGD